jgi:trimethyllysine dioxygenase
MESDDGVQLWTKLIREYGFCYVDGCPPTPEATEKLLGRIAFIRYTHYGGFWDFTSDLSSKDTAYTSIALEAHTDTTYFRDPAGLQMFHLLSHTEGTGGQSLLVDGWRAAAVLRLKSPEDYEMLKHQPMRWHCSGNIDVHIDASGPVLAEHIPHDGATLWPTTIPGPIRWNNSDRANSVGLEHTAYAAWLDAARQWDEIVKSAELEYWEQLKPGRPLSRWHVCEARPC